jgi:hypothetical protein
MVYIYIYIFIYIDINVTLILYKKKKIWTFKYIFFLGQLKLVWAWATQTSGPALTLPSILMLMLSKLMVLLGDLPVFMAILRLVFGLVLRLSYEDFMLFLLCFGWF